MENLLKAIEDLSEAISRSNSSNQLMVIITSIYVVATIVICVANLQSAKATRGQVAEQQRQFDETNRPVVDVTIEPRQKSLDLVFQNTGRKLAKDIRVEMNEEFIKKLKDPVKEGFSSPKRGIVNLTESIFSLGINQMNVISFCRLGEQAGLGKLAVKVAYRDDNSKEYSGEFNFDLELENWRFVDTSDLAQIRKCVEKIAKAYKKE